MTSPRQRYANRLNALRSTGAKSTAGEARVARNPVPHDLSVDTLPEPGWSEEIDALAALIAGGATVDRQALACRIAAAQVDLLRGRAARAQLGGLSGLNVLDEERVARRLAALSRYEWRARSREFAARAFDDAGLQATAAAAAADAAGAATASEAGPSQLAKIVGNQGGNCTGDLE
jgi:hypothetical protein